MKVCYFGSYKDREHNRIIISGLRKNGVQVKECNIRMQDLSDEIGKGGLARKRAGPGFYLKFTLKLLANYIKLARKHSRCGDYDIMIVGFPGYYMMPLAKILAKLRRKPLVYDAFISVYETVILDRKLFGRKSLLARLFHFLDSYSCNSADLVLVESLEDAKYFSREFGIPRRKLVRSFVGAEDSVFYPRKKPKARGFNAIFYGTYIPLQGIEHIVRAAKQLQRHRDIWFKLVGSGQEYDKIRRLAKDLKVSNIEFSTGWVNYKDLPKLNASADVCLGIFGTESKSKKYIPNKAFQALAMKKPLLTGDSPAAREVLVNKKDAVLCRMGDGRALAESILLLKKNPGLRARIAGNGYMTFKEKFSPEAIGRELKRNLQALGG
jgi:glycosyltransferase involved in cell wall biosynthesis